MTFDESITTICQFAGITIGADGNYDYTNCKYNPTTVKTVIEGMITGKYTFETAMSRLKNIKEDPGELLRYKLAAHYHHNERDNTYFTSVKDILVASNSILGKKFCNSPETPNVYYYVGPAQEGCAWGYTWYLHNNKETLDLYNYNGRNSIGNMCLNRNGVSPIASVYPDFYEIIETPTEKLVPISNHTSKESISDIKNDLIGKKFTTESLKYLGYFILVPRNDNCAAGYALNYKIYPLEDSYPYHSANDSDSSTPIDELYRRMYNWGSIGVPESLPENEPLLEIVEI